VASNELPPQQKITAFLISCINCIHFAPKHVLCWNHCPTCTAPGATAPRVLHLGPLPHVYCPWGHCPTGTAPGATAPRVLHLGPLPHVYCTWGHCPTCTVPGATAPRVLRLGPLPHVYCAWGHCPTCTAPGASAPHAPPSLRFCKWLSYFGLMTGTFHKLVAGMLICGDNAIYLSIIFGKTQKYPAQRTRPWRVRKSSWEWKLRWWSSSSVLSMYHGASTLSFCPDARTASIHNRSVAIRCLPLAALDDLESFPVPHRRSPTSFVALTTRKPHA
jgi:hypothetical protein